MELMQLHLSAAPSLEPLPQAEQQVLLKALAKKGDQRYPSCTEFVRALEEATSEICSGNSGGGNTQGSGNRARLPRLVALSLAFAVLLVALILALANR